MKRIFILIALMPLSAYARDLPDVALGEDIPLTASGVSTKATFVTSQSEKEPLVLVKSDAIVYVKCGPDSDDLVAKGNINDEEKVLPGIQALTGKRGGEACAVLSPGGMANVHLTSASIRSQQHRLSSK